MPSAALGGWRSLLIPHAPSHLGDETELRPFVLLSQWIADDVRCEATLGRDGQAFEVDVLTCLLDPSDQLVYVLEVRPLGGYNAEDHPFVVRNVCERLERTGPLVVVLE